jgi:hypothetical protein
VNAIISAFPAPAALPRLALHPVYRADDAD